MPDGRVAAWCSETRTGAQVWLTLDADGTNAVATPIDGVFEWPPVMAASDVGVFVLLPTDGVEVRVALFDHDGRALVAPVRVPLRAEAGGGDVSIMGVNSCMASCNGLGVVAHGNRALVEVMTIWDLVERFEIIADDDTITIWTQGVRTVATRQMLTATTTSPLSTWTRFGFVPHMTLLNWWPDQILVVERPCLRTPGG